MLLILYITFEYLWKTKQFKDTDWLPPMLVDKMKKKKKSMSVGMGWKFPVPVLHK